MFIIKLGQEALNRLEEQVAVQNVNKYSYQASHNIESSILYNLLSSDDNVKIKQEACYKMDVDGELSPRPDTVCNHSTSETVTVSPRPFSAPESYSHAKSKTNSFLSVENQIKYLDSPQSVSCSTDSFTEEPMDLSTQLSVQESRDSVKFIVNSWLVAMIELVSSNQQIISTSELPVGVRLHLLQSSWHRLLVTFLYDYLAKLHNLSVESVWRFIHTLTGASATNVKINTMCKSLIKDLHEIFQELKQFRLDEDSLNCLRIGIFLVGDQEDVNRKLLNLLDNVLNSKPGVPCQLSSSAMAPVAAAGSKGCSVAELVEKFTKLNSVIIETVFYSHLGDSVESVFDKLFYTHS